MRIVLVVHGIALLIMACFSPIMIAYAKTQVPEYMLVPFYDHGSTPVAITGLMLTFLAFFSACALFLGAIAYEPPKGK